MFPAKPLNPLVSGSVSIAMSHVMVKLAEDSASINQGEDSILPEC